jgi:hypothetical protein
MAMVGRQRPVTTDHAGAPGTRGEAVAMGVGFPGDQGIRKADHVGGDVRMQVERRDERNLRTDEVAHRPDQIAFEIGGVLRRRRTMQGEQDGIDGQPAAKAVEEFGLELRITGGRQRASGAGARVEQRHDVRLTFTQRLQHAAHHARADLEDSLAPVQVRALEAGEIDRDAAELVGLGQEGANGYARHEVIPRHVCSGICRGPTAPAGEDPGYRADRPPKDSGSAPPG